MEWKNDWVMDDKSGEKNEMRDTENRNVVKCKNDKIR